MAKSESWKSEQKSELGKSKKPQQKSQTHYGDGYMRQRGTRSFQICVEGRRGPDGERNQLWRTVRGTKTKAQAFRRALRQEVEGGHCGGSDKDYLWRILGDMAAGIGASQERPPHR